MRNKDICEGFEWLYLMLKCCVENRDVHKMLFDMFYNHLNPTFFMFSQINVQDTVLDDQMCLTGHFHACLYTYNPLEWPDCTSPAIIQCHFPDYLLFPIHCHSPNSINHWIMGTHHRNWVSLAQRNVSAKLCVSHFCQSNTEKLLI